MKKEKVILPESEDKIQSDYNIWLTAYYHELRDICFHVPNGGYRGEREANKLKSMGVKRGIPDFWHPIVCRGYGALIIEFKELGANMNTDHVKYQTHIQGILTEAGNFVTVCDSLEKAQAACLWYFAGTKWIKKTVY
jgi:hypothetical protein